MEVEERKKSVEIGLEEIHVHSSIGFYEEERLLQNGFIINIVVRLSDLPGNDNLENTVNYEVLYEIVNSVFKQNHKLIETAARIIVETCRNTWSNITGIELSIKKVAPIAGNKHGNSLIRIKENFDPTELS